MLLDEAVVADHARSFKRDQTVYDPWQPSGAEKLVWSMSRLGFRFLFHFLSRDFLVGQLHSFNANPFRLQVG